MIRAAGILFVSDRGTILLLRRVPGGDWDYPGGRCKDDAETVEQCAVREAWEEVGFRAGHSGTFLCRRVKNNVDYSTFTYPCEEFVPRLSREHDSYIWARPSDVLPAKGRPAR
jgi:8-oxo-dGTP pyrophosphatase MutT (NUDIX family)